MKPDKFYIEPEEVENYKTLREILQHARKTYPSKIAYRQFESKTEESQITFAQLGDNVDALQASLKSRGFSGKHIAIIGETSAEWITSYLAVTGGLGVCVLIDRELAPESIAHQLDFADVDAVFCSAKSVRKLQKVLPLCKPVQTVMLMRSEKTESVDGCEDVVSLKSLIETGKELIRDNGKNALIGGIDPDETCVIIYTSGTTGANKGVMLSNRNILGTLRGCARLLHFTSTSISVLPINHSYELHAHIMSCMYCGTTVCINDDLKHIVKNLEHFSPEMSCMVPIMLDLLVRKLKKGIEDSGKKELVYRMIKVSNALRKIGIDKRRTFFAEILKPLGGSLRMIICGGAALSQDTVDFLDNIGVQVYNGYGITECSPVAAVNTFKEIRRHSVGHLLPTMKVRIEDPDENGNGEIQLWGDNVMKGYYKAPEDTKQVFTKDGWFRTGDIGHTDKDNFLYISGRLKNLIILPNGKNVFPEELEDAIISRLNYIKECVVYANSANTGIFALCYPDMDFCRDNQLTTADKIKAFMQKDINEFNSIMPGYKRLTDFDITETEFEKNTTHKIQRFKIAAIKNIKGEIKNA